MIERLIPAICFAMLALGYAIQIRAVLREQDRAKKVMAARDDALAEAAEAERKVEKFRDRAEDMLVRLTDATAKYDADRLEMTATIERQHVALSDALAKLSHAEEAEKQRGRELATMTEDRDRAAQACMNHLARIGGLEEEVAALVAQKSAAEGELDSAKGELALARDVAREQAAKASKLKHENELQEKTIATLRGDVESLTSISRMRGETINAMRLERKGMDAYCEVMNEQWCAAQSDVDRMKAWAREAA